MLYLIENVNCIHSQKIGCIWLSRVTDVGKLIDPQQMWPGQQKQGLRVHKISLLFQTFMDHNFLCWYAIAMQFSSLVKHWIGKLVKLQDTDVLFDMTCYVMGCSLYPRAVFSQAQSQMCMWLDLWKIPFPHIWHANKQNAVTVDSV